MRTISVPKANDAKDQKHFYAGPSKFSLRARMKSFGYAGSGIVRFFKTEPNARVHLFSAVVVAALSLVFHISKTEAIAVIFSVAMVCITEMINTAIEKTMDFISIRKHPKIKFIKDVAAGAVLLAALSALTVGAIIFIPKIFGLAI